MNVKKYYIVIIESSFLEKVRDAKALTPDMEEEGTGQLPASLQSIQGCYVVDGGYVVDKNSL